MTMAELVLFRAGDTTYAITGWGVVVAVVLIGFVMWLVTWR